MTSASKNYAADATFCVPQFSITSLQNYVHDLVKTIPAKNEKWSTCIDKGKVLDIIVVTMQLGGHREPAHMVKIICVNSLLTNIRGT